LEHLAFQNFPGGYTSRTPALGKKGRKKKGKDREVRRKGVGLWEWRNEEKGEGTKNDGK
jgi:hypothetical protein